MKDKNIISSFFIPLSSNQLTISKIQESDVKTKKQINAKFLIVAMAIAVVFMLSFKTKAQTSDELIARAKDSIQKGEYEKAISDTSAVIKTQPNNSEAYAQRSRANFLLKNYDPAFADAEKALSIEPKNPVALNIRGLVKVNRKDSDAALADFTSAINIDPGFFKAYSNRASVYLEKSIFDKAISDYTKAIGLMNPPTAEIYSFRGNAYCGSKKYDEAISDYTKAIAADATVKEYFYNRGLAYQNKRDYDKAVDDYGQTLKLDPQYMAAQDRLKEIIAELEGVVAKENAKEEKKKKSREKWAAVGKFIDQIAAQDQPPSSGQSSTNTSSNGTSTSNSGAASGSSLPTGTYACFTTVSIYAGRGGSGAYTYPIYNSSRQTRGSIRVQSGGTYILDDGTTLHYSFGGGSIRWLDGTFAEASSSNLQTDDAGNPQILIKFNGDKDVWDCTKQ